MVLVAEETRLRGRPRLRRLDRVNANLKEVNGQVELGRKVWSRFLTHERKCVSILCSTARHMIGTYIYIY